jgi:hypothetical protein
MTVVVLEVMAVVSAWEVTALEKEFFNQVGEYVNQVTAGLTHY